MLVQSRIHWEWIRYISRTKTHLPFSMMNWKYVNNFTVCRLEKEPNCLVQEDQCSPYAECVQSGQEYHCQCLPGYKGDGTQCEPSDENTPQCLFGVCFCPREKVYDGFQCIPHTFSDKTLPMALGNNFANETENLYVKCHLLTLTYNHSFCKANFVMLPN